MVAVFKLETIFWGEWLEMVQFGLPEINYHRL